MASRVEQRFELLHRQLGKAAVIEVVQCFKKEFVETRAKLSNYLSEGSLEQIRFFAHRLKGSSLNMGATRIYNLSNELERISKFDDAKSFEKIKRIIKLIERDGDSLIHSLNGFLGDRKGAATYDPIASG